MKRNIIFNLIDRSVKLSHPKFHNKNINLVRDILLANDYPLEFIEKNIKIRLKKFSHQTPNLNTNITNQGSCNNYSRLPKICIPYHRTFFNKCKYFLNKFNIIPIPKINKNLQTFVRLGKDKCKKMDKCGTVYKINCKNCDVCYIGESKRPLNVRISEHKNNKNEKAVINLHQKNFNHKFEFENVEILDSEKTWFNRRVSEMLYLQTHTTNLNAKQDFLKLQDTYLPFLNGICK